MKYLFIAGAAALLASTAAVAGDHALHKGMDKHSFNDYLFKNYLMLEDRHDTYSDISDPRVFQDRAIDALNGKMVAPLEPRRELLDSPDFSELTAARHNLESVFANGAKKGDPEKSAYAQATYDCWVVQTETKFSYDNMLDCRSHFHKKLAMLQEAFPGKAMKKAAPAQMSDKSDMIINENFAFDVFFSLDSAELDADALRTLERVSEIMKENPTHGVRISGYTDTSGTHGYNMTLSMKRARAVAAYLRDRAVMGNDVEVLGHGENKLRVPTKDGVKEAGNRFVRIMFTQMVEKK